MAPATQDGAASVGVELAGRRAADERVEQADKQFELVYCEMDPGSALFFHSNLLHSSEQNSSEHSRWSLISCFTADYNLPFKSLSHAAPEPVRVVDDSVIKNLGAVGWSQESSFLEAPN